MSGTPAVPAAVAADLGPQSIEAITRRIAKATAHPLRVRILAALNETDMGPGDFCRKNPDVELREAGRHFRVLRELDCIELLYRQPGRGREGVYRAIRRAMFDLSSWESVPSEQKPPVTAEVVATYMGRVAQAAEAGTLDARDERWVSWTALRFDVAGWTEFIAEIEATFTEALQLGVDASLRLMGSSEPPLPVTVGLFCFESPEDPSSVNAQHQPTAPPDAFEDSFVGLRSAKAVATPLRVRILVELTRRRMSPRAFHSRFGGGTLQHVAVEFSRLEHMGCIKRVEQKRGQGRNGLAERVYQGVRRSLFDVDAWKELPNSLRTDVTSMTYTTFIERLADAARAGVLDARQDRHLTWTGLRYDQQAWENILESLRKLFGRSLDIHRESALRLETGRGSVIPVTVAMSCFESPPNSATVDEDLLRGYLT